MALRSNGENLDTPLGRGMFGPLSRPLGTRVFVSTAQPSPVSGETMEQSSLADEENKARTRAQEEWAARLAEQGFKVFRSQAGTQARSPFQPDRVTGPVQFIVRLLESWRLTTHDAALLLGLEDEVTAEALLSGLTSLRGADTKARVAALFRIKSLLASLFRDEAVEREWMNSPTPMLGGQSPIALLREGSFEKLLVLRQFVEHISGQ